MAFVKVGSFIVDKVFNHVRKTELKSTFISKDVYIKNKQIITLNSTFDIEENHQFSLFSITPIFHLICFRSDSLNMDYHYFLNNH